MVVEAASPLGLGDMARLAQPPYVVAQSLLVAGQDLVLAGVDVSLDEHVVDRVLECQPFSGHFSQMLSPAILNPTNKLPICWILSRAYTEHANTV